MTFSRVIGVLLVLCAAIVSDRAAAAEPVTTYLVPLLTREGQPGANGSIWATQWMVLNPNYQPPVTIEAPTCADDGQVCPGTAIAPRMTLFPALPPRRDGGEGAFVYVPASTVTNAVMSLRVRDLSKNAQSFGTEIPIVHAADYTREGKGLVWLLDVPTDPQYRATLRVYGSGDGPVLALVRIMAQPFVADAIEEHWLELPAPTGNEGQPADRPKYPVYVQFDPLTPGVRAAAAGGRVAISVSAAHWSSGISPPPIVPIWAFVSITDNTSQQVTTVTPHR